jgi:copper oxidase (laccase) domain-containing protein
MNQDFSFVTHGGIELLVYTPWWREGVLHGMTTQALPCPTELISEAALKLCSAFGVQQLALPKQCHGADILDLRDVSRREKLVREYGDLLRRESSDAVISPVRATNLKVSVAYGVLTADCVPVIVRGEDGFAIIHAGWRGLANGVIAKAVSLLNRPLQAVVFAAAGGEQYEVGAEVIDAIGVTSVSVPSSNRPNAFLLDTAATAINQLQMLSKELQVVGAGICTISDSRFHSFRRDGERAGRAITMVIPPR